MAPPSPVFFVPLRDVADSAATLRALDALWDRSGARQLVPRGGTMAIKMHFGDEGNHRTVPACCARQIGLRIAEAGAQPFATDTTTLYSGPRTDAVSHLMLASQHGYTTESLGMPVIVADGLRGQDQIVVPFDGVHFRNCSLASAWGAIAGFVLLTHMTGHCQVGMGAALKNAGMGWASRGGKRMQHSATKPEIDPAVCTGCGTCVKRCPASALKLAGDSPTLDRDACIGCGQCFSVCPSEAVGYDWDAADVALQEKIAEYAAAAVMPKRPHVLGITFLTRITRQCDCMGADHDYRLPDVGIAASADIVALDQASHDLCDRAHGGDFFESLWPGLDPTVQLAHAERVGLGRREYALVEIGAVA